MHGSLASGDFNPQSSDIDFLVVTQDELPVELLPELAAKLEGFYISAAALRRYDPPHVEYPVLRVDGTFAVDGHGTD